MTWSHTSGLPDYDLTDSAAHGGGQSRAWARARKIYRRFHCFPAPRIYRLRCPRINPAVQADLGELRGLIYRATRGPCERPRTFVHFLETPARLTCDPTGRQLYIQGGNYRITQRGIEG